MWQSIAGKGKDTSPRRIEKSASADSGGIKSDMRVNEGEGSSDNNNNETPPEDTDKKNILFEIGPNNEIILNGNPRPIIATQIRSNIDQLKAENPAASVIIQPDNSSEVSTLVMIMDAARQAGMANISIVEPN